MHPLFDVWLVWNGLGGNVFEVLATESDADVALAYHQDMCRPNSLEKRKFSVKNCLAWDGGDK